jgi:flagellin-like protein
MKNKMDARGITPVIATILLIAATVAAGTLIAVYVSGLYIGGTRIVAGDISGAVFDNTPGPVENYVNENVTIRFKTTTGYLRDIGDPDTGLTVTIRNDAKGWGPVTVSLKGTESNYPKYYCSKADNDLTLKGQTVGWHLYVPCRTDGRLERGSEGYLYLWTYGTREGKTAAATKPTLVKLWDDDDYIGIVVGAGGDSFTTRFGTVRLSGQALP